MNISKFVVYTLSAVFAISLFGADASKKSAAELAKEYMKKDMATLKNLGEPKLGKNGQATFIVLPDTQTYTPRIKNQPVLDLMTSWIAYNAKRLNVKGVLCTGDIVEHNGTLATNFGELETDREMWNWVSHCYGRLDNKVPYILCTGNHDYGRKWYLNEKDYASRVSNFKDYFHPSRNLKNKESLVEVFYTREGIETLENAAYLLDIGGKWGQVVVITLEYAPRKETLEWACNFLQKSKTAKGRRAILLTHGFMDTKGQINGYFKNTYKMLVEKCPAIKLVVCGHFCENVTDFENTSVFKTFEREDDGTKFSAMMFNCQTIGGGFGGNGGDGWLRILEFQKDGKTIKASTYSPLFGFSPMTKNLAWRTAPYDMFEFELEAPEK